MQRREDPDHATARDEETEGPLRHRHDVHRRGPGYSGRRGRNLLIVILSREATKNPPLQVRTTFQIVRCAPGANRALRMATGQQHPQAGGGWAGPPAPTGIPSTMSSPLARTRYQRRNASTRITHAQAIITAVRTRSTSPCAAVDPTETIGRKLSVMLSQPATSVVVVTKSIGTSVTQTYRTFPALIMALEATARATPARSWLAIPNIGQTVLMLPVCIKYAQPATTRPEERIVPGIQSDFSRGFQMRPANS